MELGDFLDTVITAPEPGFFCLAVGPPNGSEWYEKWYRWPAQKADILTEIARMRGGQNVYFSSYLFKSSSSVKSNVLRTRTIQADLDEAHIEDLPIEPTILVQTSPGRHQAYWVLRGEPLELETHELLSRKLTYGIPKCDHSGWALGRKVRVPDTFNFKYLDGPKPIEVIRTNDRPLDANDFEMLPDNIAAYASTLGDDVEDFLETSASIKLNIGPQELLETVREKLPAKVYIQYNSLAVDRSAAIWSLELSAFKAGLSRQEVFWLAFHSVNNKFSELRRNGARELAKDVLRAEQLVRSSGSDPKEVVTSAKRATGPAVIRKQNILNLTLDFMKQRGTFLHATNDSLWYIRRDLGRPITLSLHSDYLDALLDLEYGLNTTEVEHAFSVSGLCAYARNLQPTSHQNALSFYDEGTNTLMLHSGRKDVYRVSATGVETIVDGSQGIIFPWQIWVEPFRITASADPRVSADWAEVLFGHSADGDALENVIGMKRESVLALLRVWLLFLLFRNAAISRPILATFGAPGSGKSTLFRKLYALLYGRTKSVSSVTNMDDFDHSVSTDPFVVLDNVDSWERWLPDRLALSASTSDIVRRKLYTDSDQVVLKRQALLGITAHNPRFGREDVADRLLLLTYERLPYFIPEQLIIDNIVANRSAIWAGIVADIQLVLATPQPQVPPQFRVEDFARLGLWFAKALNIEDEFREALISVRFGQRSFSLEEDTILVSALRQLATKTPQIDKTTSQLWGQLELESGQNAPAFIKTYGNSVRLGKKLLALQDALRLILDVSWKYDPKMGQKLWTVKTKPENLNGNGTAPHD